MQEWKIKAIVKIALTAIGGALSVKFPDDQICIIVLTALAVILVIILWPVEEEVEELYLPEPPAFERLRETLDRPHKQIRESLKEAGWKTRKVKKRRWIWSRFFD